MFLFIVVVINYNKFLFIFIMINKLYTLLCSSANSEFIEYGMLYGVLQLIIKYFLLLYEGIL